VCAAKPILHWKTSAGLWRLCRHNAFHNDNKTSITLHGFYRLITQKFLRELKADEQQDFFDQRLEEK
jgi:hypothetical protein